MAPSRSCVLCALLVVGFVSEMRAATKDMPNLTAAGNKLSDAYTALTPASAPLSQFKATTPHTQVVVFLIDGSGDVRYLPRNDNAALDDDVVAFNGLHATDYTVVAYFPPRGGHIDESGIVGVFAMRDDGGGGDLVPPRPRDIMVVGSAVGVALLLVWSVSQALRRRGTA